MDTSFPRRSSKTTFMEAARDALVVLHEELDRHEREQWVRDRLADAVDLDERGWWDLLALKYRKYYLTWAHSLPASKRLIARFQGIPAFDRLWAAVHRYWEELLEAERQQEARRPREAALRVYEVALECAARLLRIGGGSQARHGRSAYRELKQWRRTGEVACQSLIRRRFGDTDDLGSSDRGRRSPPLEAFEYMREYAVKAAEALVEQGKDARIPVGNLFGGAVGDNPTFTVGQGVACRVCQCVTMGRDMVEHRVNDLWIRQLIDCDQFRSEAREFLEHLFAYREDEKRQAMLEPFRRAEALTGVVVVGLEEEKERLRGPCPSCGITAWDKDVSFTLVVSPPMLIPPLAYRPPLRGGGRRFDP